MALTDELERLAALHAKGELSDDEFRAAKARLLDPASPASPAMQTASRMRRSRSDRWIAGVCGGIGAATAVDAWVWRLILVALAFYGGSGLLLYILLWIFVPDE